MTRTTVFGIVIALVVGWTEVGQAQQDLQRGVQDLVQQMIASMEQQQKRKLAILDFTKLDGSVDNFGRYLAERLITTMFLTRKFEVIERRQLDKILAELKLNLSDLIDPQNAKRLGKVYGVDAIASGSVTELAGSVEINARLIETETGRVFAVASTRLSKDKDVAMLLSPARTSASQYATGKSAPGGGKPSVEAFGIPFFSRIKDKVIAVAQVPYEPKVIAISGPLSNVRVQGWRQGAQVKIPPATIKEAEAMEGLINGERNRSVVVLRDGRRFEVNGLQVFTHYSGGSWYLSRVYWDDVNDKEVINERWQPPSIRKIIFVD